MDNEAIPRKKKKVDAKTERNDPRKTSAQQAIKLGPRLKQIRQGRGWTLEQTAQRSGVARSTLSKIENDTMSPTFEIIQKIARGLGVDIVEFFDMGIHTGPLGRRSVNRRGSGRRLQSDTYDLEVLSTDLVRKRILPFRARIKARSVQEFKKLLSHRGEEFVYVLSGKISIHTDLYEDVVLEAGESIYFDSLMRHGITSIGDEDAEVLWVCSDDIPVMS